MTDLPARPSVDHLGRRARNLLRDAQAGDGTAIGRIRAVSDALTLASAQLTVAREYGFASWGPRSRPRSPPARLDLARQAEAFCVGQHPRLDRPAPSGCWQATPGDRRLQLRHRGDPRRRQPGVRREISRDPGRGDPAR